MMCRKEKKMKLSLSLLLMNLVYFFKANTILIENTIACKCASTKWHSSKGCGILIALNATPGFQLFEIALHGR